MKLKEKFDKDKLYFTSDTHFSHENIIRYTNRPFKDAKEMNEALIENWNNKVPKDGVVFHLGDVSLTGEKILKDIMNKLNGKLKHLIIGNHEKDALASPYMRDQWRSINDILEIEIEDEEIEGGKQEIIMCHYPMIVWRASHRGSWQLFGHVHGGLSNKGIIQHKPTQLDVGVDSHLYTPLSYQEVKEIITKQCLK